MFKSKLNILRKKPLKFLIMVLTVIVAVAAVFIVVKAASTYTSDTFTDETKIGKGTATVEINTSSGQVTLAPCYEANPSWTKLADTTVRDINGTYDATADKDIYCDGNNCILYTDEQVPPTSVCIATNSNVYANILWSKTNSTSSQWGNYGVSLEGDDIGGTHGNIGVGNNNININGKNWLERYYISDAGTYPAMDECKTKGSGWRLPTILELDSIRDQAKGEAPYSRLPGIASSDYWSSSEYSSAGGCRLYFASGYVYTASKSSSLYVRCVRGQ